MDHKGPETARIYTEVDSEVIAGAVDRELFLEGQSSVLSQEFAHKIWRCSPGFDRRSWSR